MSEEFSIFAERFMHFLNLWTTYQDMLTGYYKPSVDPGKGEWSITAPASTAMLVLYSYFYSLVEDDDRSVNAFRTWRQRFPEEETAIAAVEAKIAPFRERLRLLRNRLGFHGSRTRTHELGGLDLFSQHSGTEILEAIKIFKALGAVLFAKDNARQGMKGYDMQKVRRNIDAIESRCKGKG